MESFHINKLNDMALHHCPKMARYELGSHHSTSHSPIWWCSASLLPTSHWHHFHTHTGWPEAHILETVNLVSVRGLDSSPETIEETSKSLHLNRFHHLNMSPARSVYKYDEICCSLRETAYNNNLDETQNWVTIQCEAHTGSQLRVFVPHTVGWEIS